MRSITALKISLIISAHLFFNEINAQIEKGSWIIGGNGSLSNTKANNSNILFNRYLYINIDNNTGYFFKNKFAAGVKSSFSYTKIVTYETYGNSITELKPMYGLGMYTRYYILPLDKRINFLAELKYQRYFPGGKNISPKITHGSGITLGSVLFLNDVIGVEYTISYGSSPTFSRGYFANTLQTGIGLQIHLKKEKF
jgi:hypothetical protein